jgi:hypothetical protein
MFMTIPTLMTWTRILAIPLIVGVFYLDIPTATRNLVATVMFIVFAVDRLAGRLFGPQAESNLGLWRFSRPRGRQVFGLCLCAGAGATAAR